jgi:aspartate kinase
MSEPPVVVKLGGDALASPPRIAAQARRLARRAGEGPVLAVASARRGVTDHLLGLANEVAAHAGGSAPGRCGRPGQAERDRAVASGEVVSAALLALALNQLGVPAISLDAREAGVLSRGRVGATRIHAVIPRRLSRLLSQGVIPVVTGFQGWQRGRVATLGRGGTDASAVALAVALGSSRTIFVKQAPGLRTADPRIVPDAALIPEASHDFLSALTGAGSRVVQAEAAALAERSGVPLEFWSLDGEAPESLVRRGATGSGLRAVATEVGEAEGRVTVLAGSPGGLVHESEQLREALIAAGIPCRDIQPAANGLRFIVAAALAGEATRALHAAFVSRRSGSSTRRAS